MHFGYYSKLNVTISFLFTVLIIVSQALIIVAEHSSNLTNHYFQELETGIKPQELVGRKIPALYIWREKGLVYRISDYINSISRCGIGELFSNWEKDVVDGVFYIASSDNGNLVVVGDNGYIYFRIGDGKSFETVSYEELFENATRDLYWAIGDIGRYLDIVGDDFSIVYKGVSGEGRVESIKGVEIYPNGTTKVLNNTSIEYVNPYDVYYVVIDGYRLEPPIIIRAIKPGSTKLCTKIQYLKALLPIAREYKRIEITEDIVNDIIEIYSDNTGVKADDIRVYDIYLAISKDNEYLLPTIKVGSPTSNIVYWFQITWDGKVEVLVTAAFSGPPSSSENEGGLIEGDEIFNKMNKVPTALKDKNALITIISILLAILLIATALLVTMVYRKKS